MPANLEAITNLGRRVYTLRHLSQEPNPTRAQEFYFSDYLPTTGLDESAVRATSAGLDANPSMWRGMLPRSLDSDSNELSSKVEEAPRNVLSQLNQGQVIGIGWNIAGDETYRAAEQQIQTENYGALTGFLLSRVEGENPLWNMIVARVSSNIQSLIAASQSYIETAKMNFVYTNLSTEVGDREEQRREYDQRIAVNFLVNSINNLSTPEKKKAYITIGVEYARTHD